MTESKPIGAEARKPNPTLEPFAFLIGEWRTTGTHPGVPGEELRGRTSFAWHESGAFVMMRSQVDHPDFPDGLAIIGSDDSLGTFAMTYFDERGVSRLIDMTVGDRTVSWRHDDPKFRQELTIAAEGDDRLVSKGRMSRDGGAWEDDLSQVLERED